MKIYIDQSSKIEYTSQDTVIAYANGKQKSLMIRAGEKRIIKEVFRRAGKPHIFVYKTFAVLIFLLIRNDLKEIKSIVIDQEYQGKEPLIKDFILQMIRRRIKVGVAKDDIWFEQIGKKAGAHKKAINTFRGKMEPDMVVQASHVLPYIV